MANVSPRAFRLSRTLSIVIGLWAGSVEADAPRIAFEPVATWERGADELTQPVERLFLAVRLNARERGVFEFHRIGPNLAASSDTLLSIGLSLPPMADAGERNLSDIDGLVALFDDASQTLELNAETQLLAAPPAALNQQQYAAILATSSTGFVLNYDLYAGVGDGSSDASGLFVARAFSGRTVLETTGLGSWHRASGQDRSRAVRLDTTLTRVWPDKRLRLEVGDYVSGSVNWSRPMRLTGLQIGTDFSLQPYLPTAPMPTFMGSAALPSQVELFVDGVRRWEGDVAAGRFTVGAGPGRIDGSGKAQLVMTDILGRVSTQEFTFYETSRLLRQGLSQWSAAIGVARLGYGDLSFSYGDEPVFSGAWRRGLRDRFTLEAHGEAGPRSALAGLGGVWLMGSKGELSGSFSASWGRNNGQQWTLGYSWRSGNFNVSANLLRASRGYGDIASRWGGGPPLAIDTGQIGYTNRHLGALSLSYLRLGRADDTQSRFAMLNWSRPLALPLTVTANLRQNLNRRDDRSAFISLNMTLGTKLYSSLGLQSQESGMSFTGSLQQNAPNEGGFGWRADLLGGAGRWQGQAQVNWLGDFGEAQARMEATSGNRSLHAGFSGSIAMLDGTLLPSRRIEDGFALVKTGDAAETPVLVHNRPVGKTSKNGRLLVTGLHAFEENAISIEPASLGPDYAVGAVTAIAVPSDRAGVQIAFPVRKIHSLVATVIDRSGRFVPAGVLAQVEGQAEPVTIGFDGLLYLEEPHPVARVTIKLAEGTCAFRLPADVPPGTPAKLGTLVCEMMQ